MSLFRKFFYTENANGIVEYGLLIGAIGFSFYLIWKDMQSALLSSYIFILSKIRKPVFP